MQYINKLLLLISHQERKSSIVLLIMSIIVALIEMLGIASILPFMAVLSNPSIIDTNIILNFAFQTLAKFGIETYNDFLFVLGVFVFLLLIISTSCKAFEEYKKTRLIYMLEHSIGKRLIEGYLYQPYSWFLSVHSADLGKTILSEVSSIITGGMRPLIDLIAKSILAIIIIALLVTVDPKLTLIVSLILCSVYLLIFYFVRSLLRNNGKNRLKNNQLRFKVVSEAFGAAKDVKVGGLEKLFIQNFSNAAQIYARSISFSQIIALLPRYILEIFTFGGILLIILFSIFKNGNFNDSLPVISLYIFAGYRLIPALQQIYISFTKLTFIGPSINKLYEDIKNLKSFKNDKNQNTLVFNKKITLNQICYDYPNSSRIALKNINLTIAAKSTIGLIGQTGCGKTTTVDIILGLLNPKKVL